MYLVTLHHWYYHNEWTAWVLLLQIQDFNSEYFYMWYHYFYWSKSSEYFFHCWTCRIRQVVSLESCKMCWKINRSGPEQGQVLNKLDQKLHDVFFWFVIILIWRAVKEYISGLKTLERSFRHAADRKYMSSKTGNRSPTPPPASDWTQCIISSTWQKLNWDQTKQTHLHITEQLSHYSAGSESVQPVVIWANWSFNLCV